MRVYTMKPYRWSFFVIGLSLLGIQACSHAPQPQETTWSEPAAGKFRCLAGNIPSSPVNGNMRKAGWWCP